MSLREMLMGLTDEQLEAAFKRNNIDTSCEACMWKFLNEGSCKQVLTHTCEKYGPFRCKFAPVSLYGSHMTLERFKEGNFIDDDGCGYYATAIQMTNVEVHLPGDSSEVDPMLVKDLPEPREQFTHIVWYNK